MTALEARGLGKHYVGGDGGVITVLDGVDLAVDRGEMVAIIGASGAGKSTLLHLLGALDRPTTGDVLVAGQALSGLHDDAVSALRNRTIGFVFQFHHLLREFTALENVMMPLRIAGGDEGTARWSSECRTSSIEVGLMSPGQWGPSPVTDVRRTVRLDEAHSE